MAIEPDIAAEAARRQAELGKSHGTPLQDNCPEGVEVGQTRDQVAATVEIGSGKTYERGKKIVEEATAMAKAGEVDPVTAPIVAKIEAGTALPADATGSAGSASRNRRTR